jgi:tripartite-type tricarboxylate transporter receptor subunit TctC
MPGAGSLVAANQIYNVAPKDGTVIGVINRGVPFEAVLGGGGVQFDPRKFNWLGSIGKLQNVCAIWHEHPIKTIEQARQQEFTAAGAGATSNTVIVPRILNALLGTKIKVIAGYEPGQGDAIAMESREVDGVCGLAWSTIKASRAHWIKEKKINILVQMAMEKLPDLPDTPGALELVSGENRQILELILIRQEMGRPFAAPPGVPADRVAALRQAFDATLKDEAFLEEARMAQLEIEPLTGQRIDELLAGAYAAPRAIVDKAASLLNPPGSDK